MNANTTAKELTQLIFDWAEPAYKIRKHRDDLAQLKQKNQPGTRYIEQFKSICLKIPSLSNTERFERFLEGVRPEIRIAILQQTFDNLETAYRVALAYEGVRVGAQQPHHDHHSRHGVPMEVDAVDDRGNLRPLTQEQRQYLIDNNGCFACRRTHAGHLARNCPHRNQARQARGVQPGAAVNVHKVRW
jgi:hypothetical protein